MSSNALDVRMKENYERRSQTWLTRRIPVIIRLDGKAFHTFTRGFSRPYDTVFHQAMNATLLFLCKNIQGCKFGYTQSDEITLVLTDYDKLNTDAWFDYNVQKMCSVSASMATLEFNRAFPKACSEWLDNTPLFEAPNRDLLDAYNRAVESGATFDSRCFNIPEDEVANCVIWRQNDASRNAVQMLGQAHFSHKQLQGKSQSNVQDMLMEAYNINFNDMPTEFKRGVCCYRGSDGKWVLDGEDPIISKNRAYMEQHLPEKVYD